MQLPELWLPRDIMSPLSFLSLDTRRWICAINSLLSKLLETIQGEQKNINNMEVAGVPLNQMPLESIWLYTENCFTKHPRVHPVQSPLAPWFNRCGSMLCKSCQSASGLQLVIAAMAGLAE